MNTVFSWDRNSLYQEDTFSGVPHLREKDMVRESISKMKNGKAAGPSDVVSEIVKTAGEAGVDMIKDLVNQIIVEGSIPAEWEPSTIVNCYKEKANSLERGNYKGLKLAD